MADPNEVIQMTHPDVKDDDGPVVVEVTRHQYESVWKAVGWRLTPTKKKEGN